MSQLVRKVTLSAAFALKSVRYTLLAMNVAEHISLLRAAINCSPPGTLCTASDKRVSGRTGLPGQLQGTPKCCAYINCRLKN